MRFFDKVQFEKFTIALLFIFILSMVVYYFSSGHSVKLLPTCKYPPHSYYILHDMLICGVLWTIRDILKRLLNCKLVQMIGQNIVWIY